MKTFNLSVKLLLAAVFILFTTSLFATKQDVSGSISTNTTWSTDTVFVTNNIVIGSSAKLIINPKTKVLFRGNYSISINGILRAVGGPDTDTIRFSMTETDSMGYYIPSNTIGGWAGFFINSSTLNDSIVFKYCRFEFIKKTGMYPVSINFSAGYKLDISNSLFYLNQGGISSTAGTNLNIKDCKFYQNYYLSNAGAQYYEIESSSAISSIIGNSFITSASYVIKALNSANASSENNTITIIRNKKLNSRNYNSIYYSYVNSGSIANNTLSHITANTDNGVNIVSSKVDIVGNSVTNYGNSIDDYGIKLSSSSGQLRGNKITLCRIGIDCLSSNFNLYNDTVTNCSVKGIYIHGISVDTIKNSIIKDCPIGIESLQAQLELINCAFTKNTAYSILLDKSKLNLINCLLANNSSATYGSAVYSRYSTVNIVNSTITNNADVGASHAPVVFTSTGGDIINTIFWGNMANTGSAQICFTDNDLQPSFYNCDIQGGSGGFVKQSGVTFNGGYNSACLDSDPYFILPTSVAGSAEDALDMGIDWRLDTLSSHFSPCINAGITSKNSTLIDYKGNSRVLNGVIDIGACEIRINNKTFTGTTISGTEHWINDTVFVTNNISITNTGILIIDPGVVVSFKGQLKITCNGLLKAIGTEQSRVTFTEFDITSYSGTGTAGGWKGISFRADATENDTSQLKYCNFNYLKDSISINDRNKIKIENCQFEHAKSWSSGIPCIGVTNSIIQFNDNTFNDINEFRNLIMCTNSTVLVNNNFVYNNNGPFWQEMILFTESDVIFTRNKLINNINTGIGLIRFNRSKTYCTNNLIVNNNTVYIISALGGPDSYIANNTISRNNNSSHIFNIENALLENNILVNNNVQTIAANLNFSSILRNNFISISTTITNASCTDCIMNDNAQFLSPTSSNGFISDAENNNWHLSVMSSAINNGYEDGSNLLATDLDNNNRVHAQIVDIGAYEHQGSKPSFVTQPIAQELCAGQQLTLSVVPNDLVAFQWQKDGKDIPGGTSHTYTRATSTPLHQGIYTCKITNGFGTTISDQASVIVKIPPTVFSPESRFENTGSSFSIPVAVTGTDTITYQWHRDNNPVSGQITSSLAINSFTAGTNDGIYKLVATNDCGTATTSEFAVYITPVATVTGILCAGEELTFYVTSSADLTYQWKKDGANVGINSDSYTINGASTDDDGIYTCLVSNTPYQSMESNPVLISIKEKPEIVSQPASALITPGSDVPLSVAATGSTPFTYQWYKDGAPIGINSSTYTIDDFSLSTEGKYSVTVSNDYCGLDATGDISFFIEPTASIIANDGIYCKGEYIKLKVKDNFTATYQWYKDGIIVSGATKDSLEIVSASLNDAGSYYCLVTSAYGIKATNSLTIAISEAPEILVQPASQWALIGSAFELNITASGTKPLNYEWVINNEPKGVSVNSQFIKASFAATDSGKYYCGVSNTCGNANSGIAYVYSTPKITLWPDNNSPCEGSSLELSAESGTGSTYQWYKDGAVISGQTLATLTLNNITSASAGNYSCLVTKSGQSKTTETRTINVLTAPNIVLNPSSQWTVAGNPYTLEISANGSKPIDFQWFKDGDSIPGKISNSMTISNFQSGNEGYYYCTADNSCGIVTSNTAYLYITPKITITNYNGHAIPCETDKITLDANSGSGATYQWYKDGIAVTDSTNEVYRLASISQANAGNYYCEVTRSGITKLTETRTIAVQTAPSVLVQPSSQWAVTGNGYTVEVVANGSNPLNYEWYKDGSEAGGTNSNANYIILGFVSGNEGRYYCQVSNVCGTKTSADAFLYITPKIIITNNNGHEIPCETDKVTLDASMGGGATYQWYKDGIAVTDSTNAVFRIVSISQVNAGSYYCEVTRSGLTKPTETRTVSVQTAPEILVQPASQWTTATLTYTLDISATGSKPIDYQWYKGVDLIDGKTINTLTLADFKTTDEGYYYCKAHNVCGTATSSNAYMYISPKLTLTNNNGHSTFCESDTVNLSAFSGSGSTYKWYKNGVEISGETLSSLKFDSVTIADEGSYYCEVKRSGIMKQTETRVVTMQTLPEIVTQPLSQWVTAGKSYTAEISVMGSKPYVYLWHKDNIPILNGDAARYPITGFASGNEGNYMCRVENACGVDSSNDAFMYITPSITLTNKGGHTVPCEGDTVILNVAAGIGATYRWYKDGNTISNTTATLKFDSLTINDEGTYFCQVTINGNTKSTDVKSIFVQSAPEVLLSPASQWIAIGEGYTLEVSAQGSKPLIYQWYKNGTEKSGETNSRYSLASFQLTDEAVYYCNVSNACGIALSEQAFVYVNPAITLTNTGHAVPCEGDTAVLSVTAGSDVTYQWYKDGSAISNTTSTLRLDSLTSDDEGVYYCQVKRNGETKSTSSKTIIIQNAPAILLSPASQWANVGETYSLDVSVLGSKPLNFQWYKNNATIGDNASSYILANFSNSLEGTYRCKISNYCGVVETGDAYVYINPRMTVTNLNGKAIPCDGDTVMFNAYSGDGATYQWYKDGNAIADSTRPKLVYNKMNKDNEGTYYCNVSRGTFSKPTESKIVFIAYAPEIFVQPASQWVPKDGDYTIEVAASGSKPLIYQWFRNDTVRTGVEGSRYVIAGIKQTDEGIYRCRISNACGVETSTSVYVYIDPQITVSNNSKHNEICEKDAIVLNAYSGEKASYQWYKDGNLIDKAINATIVYNGITSAGVGNYYCIVTKGLQSKPSENRVINVQTPPEILIQPTSQWTTEGSAYTLEVSAGGSKPFTYNWYYDLTPIGDSTSASHIITGMDLSKEGRYYINVKNACGVVTTKDAYLLLSPKITVNNNSGHVVYCKSDMVSLEATPSVGAVYQWYKDGDLLSGKTTPALLFNQLATQDAGNYYCIVTRNGLSKQTETRTVAVQLAPGILAQPQSQWVYDNSTFKLSIIADGSKPLQYTWKLDTVALSDTLPNIEFDNFAQVNEGNYICAVSNVCGSITSNAANLKVAPELTNNSGSSVCENDTFELGVAFNDNAKYQWYKEGKQITGAIDKTFSILNTKFSNIGNYQCRVSNANGYAILGPVQLTLRKAPSVEMLDSTTYVDATLSVSIEATAAGDEPLEYQWLKNDSALSGNMLSSFILNGVTIGDEANYKCRVKNNCGEVETNETKLVIAPQLCMVTNDFETDSNSNMLIWDRNSSYAYHHFNVYRESYIRDKYDKIGEIPYKALTTFVDLSVNPKSQAFMYKITAVDSVNKETDINFTAPHKTIHLLVTQGIPEGIQLDWDEYIGFDYSTYSIFRSVDNAAFEKIDSMASTSRTWTDFSAPVTKDLKYFVSVKREDACYANSQKKAGAGPFVSAYSNMEDNSRIKWTADAIDNIYIKGFEVFPNPFTDIAEIRYHLEKNSDVSITIHDFSGRMIKTITDNVQIAGNYNYTFGEELQKGVYLLNVRVSDKTDIVKVVKIK